MRRRLASWSLLLAAPVACTEPAARAPAAAGPEAGSTASPRQVLADWERRAAAVTACTATYRVTGPIEETLRITYVAPDRARMDAAGTRDGMRFDDSAWTLPDRAVFRSQRGEERAWAEIPSGAVSGAEHDAIVAAADRAFPAPPSGASVPEFGPGVTLDLVCEPDARHPEHGQLDTLAVWRKRRDRVYGWLPRLAAMPKLRDDGARIVGEDPETGYVFALSKANGFLESVATPAGLKVELVAWEPVADGAAFTIPPPPPGASDVSKDYRSALAALCEREIDAAITLQAVTARRLGKIGDDDFRARLGAVFEVAHRSLLRDRLARTRESIQRRSDAATEQYAANFAASASDRDLRQFCETRVAEERAALADGLRALAEETARFHPPHEADLDARTAELVDEARRRSRTEWFEREMTQPLLARFDERVAKVREGK